MVDTNNDGVTDGSKSSDAPSGVSASTGNKITKKIVIDSKKKRSKSKSRSSSGGSSNSSNSSSISGSTTNTEGSIAALAKKYGGYNKIPQSEYEKVNKQYGTNYSGGTSGSSRSSANKTQLRQAVLQEANRQGVQLTDNEINARVAALQRDEPLSEQSIINRRTGQVTYNAEPVPVNQAQPRSTQTVSNVRKSVSEQRAETNAFNRNRRGQTKRSDQAITNPYTGKTISTTGQKSQQAIINPQDQIVKNTQIVQDSAFFRKAIPNQQARNVVQRGFNFAEEKIANSPFAALANVFTEKTSSVKKGGVAVAEVGLLSAGGAFAASGKVAVGAIVASPAFGDVARSGARASLSPEDSVLFEAAKSKGTIARTNTEFEDELFKLNKPQGYVEQVFRTSRLSPELRDFYGDTLKDNLLEDGFSENQANRILKISNRVEDFSAFGEAIGVVTGSAGIEAVGSKILGKTFLKSATATAPQRFVQVGGVTGSLGAVEGGAQEFLAQTSRGQDVNFSNIAINSAFGAGSAGLLGGAIGSSKGTGKLFFEGTGNILDPSEPLGDALAFTGNKLDNVFRPNRAVNAIDSVETISVRKTGVSRTKRISANPLTISASTSSVSTPSFSTVPFSANTDVFKSTSRVPSEVPSDIPVQFPTNTNVPSQTQTQFPTEIPTDVFSKIPTNVFTQVNTRAQTNVPVNTFTPQNFGAPFLPLGGGGGGRGRRSSKSSDPFRAYTSSLTSKVFNIRGKQSSKKELGLGLRPLL